MRRVSGTPRTGPRGIALSLRATEHVAEHRSRGDLTLAEQKRTRSKLYEMLLLPPSRHFLEKNFRKHIDSARASAGEVACSPLGMPSSSRFIHRFNLTGPFSSVTLFLTLSTGAVSPSIIARERQARGRACVHVRTRVVDCKRVIHSMEGGAYG